MGQVKFDYGDLVPVLAFGAGILVCYLFSPENWYHDAVQKCLNLGVLSDRECFMKPAEFSYEQYMKNG